MPISENVLNHPRVQAKAQIGIDVDDVGGAAQQDQDKDGAHDAGDQGGQRRARRAHIEAEDEQRIAADVDAVHDDGDGHRNLGVAHRAEQRRAGIVQGDKGVGQGGQEKVRFRAGHNVGLNVVVEQSQNLRAAKDKDGSDGGGQDKDSQHQLLGSLTGFA